LKIAQRQSNTFGHFPAIFLYPYSSAHQLPNSLVRAFPTGYRQKCGTFHPFSLKHYILVFIYIIKNRRHLKTLSNSSPLIIFYRTTQLLARLNPRRQFLEDVSTFDEDVDRRIQKYCSCSAIKKGNFYTSM
jgi:hypothetical protein